MTALTIIMYAIAGGAISITIMKFVDSIRNYMETMEKLEKWRRTRVEGPLSLFLFPYKLLLL